MTATRFPLDCQGLGLTASAILPICTGAPASISKPARSWTCWTTPAPALPGHPAARTPAPAFRNPVENQRVQQPRQNRFPETIGGMAAPWRCAAAASRQRRAWRSILLGSSSDPVDHGAAGLCQPLAVNDDVPRHPLLEERDQVTDLRVLRDRVGLDEGVADPGATSSGHGPYRGRPTSPHSLRRTRCARLRMAGSSGAAGQLSKSSSGRMLSATTWPPASTCTNGVSVVPAPARGRRSPRRICPFRARPTPADCRPGGSACLSLRAAAHRGRATGRHRR